jgi:hypothetical protein
LQDNRKIRSRGRSRPQPNGQAADFARSVARAEFGRFYVDEARLQEAKRSVEAAIARRKPAPRPKAEPPQAAKPTAEGRTDAHEAKASAKTRHVPWRAPSVRERRTEIAEGLDRLRKEKGGGK